MPRSVENVSMPPPFTWHVPDRFNIGFDACDKWADGAGRLALLHENHSGDQSTYTFDELKWRSNQLANLWRECGVGRGDRIAICLPQCPEAGIAHVAAYKLGAVAVPLFTLFGPDALRFRLADSGAKVLLTNAVGAAKVEEIRTTLPSLKELWCVDGEGGEFRALWTDLDAQSADFDVVDTHANDPALIIYTSGTTGSPKGALHAHRVLLGHLPGVEISHDGFPKHGDRIWTPADWAWIGGLLDVLLPAWHHGIPVVSRRFEKFNAESAFEFIARHSVRNVFLPPTALRQMRTIAEPRARWSLNLRSIASGGESLGSELLTWGRSALGVTINEFYGQTECNMVLSSCGTCFEPLPGAIGKPVAGHDVQIVDDDGNVVPAGVIGNIAIKAPDPVMFLGYWNNETATQEKFRRDYLITGDLGVQEVGGYIRFVGRNDDVINSSGYRVGPGPIEDCLMQHPAVQLAAVVGIPDANRTEIVKAFVVLKPGFLRSDALTESIQNLVKTRLAAHEYPRAVAYLDSLPMTATGKVIRRDLRNAHAT